MGRELLFESADGVRFGVELCEDLQFMIGASKTLGGDPLSDAFGVVATVAMMPLISIQAVGVIYERRKKPAEKGETFADDEIIELWEVQTG